MSLIVLCANTNLPELPATQFTSFGFTGLTVFAGDLIGVNSTGIFKCLTGDHDNEWPIDAWFEIAQTDFAIINQKQVRSIFATGRFGACMKVTVQFDDGASEEYVATLLDGMEHSSFKVPVNAFPQGQCVKVTLSNTKGGDFMIHSLDAIVIFRHTTPVGLFSA